MSKARKRLSKQELITGILAGNQVILSRAITLIESTLEEDHKLASEIINALLPHHQSTLRIGITGVPGVGKSTFIESFGKQLCDSGKKVAVLAIDPSSQKTGGSILGDKTRMEQLSNHKNAFIRPTPTGSSLGGVANKTRETMLLCEAAGFEIILIETVGVGQSETAVRGMVDFFLLLMLAGAGDELQGIKKGIMEMADAIAITKADDENIKAAKAAKQEYQNAFHLFPPACNGWQPKVLICSAMKNTGINDVWQTILAFEKTVKENHYFESNRQSQNLNWFQDLVNEAVLHQFYHHGEVKSQIGKLSESVKKGEMSPWSAADLLLTASNQ